VQEQDVFSPTPLFIFRVGSEPPPLSKWYPPNPLSLKLVPPGRRVVVAFDANNPGLWALHCHLLYHLEAGMFTTLRYV
jgi:FtsP/CotA-like multicopper oxidase with cupredoxin domain